MVTVLLTAGVSCRRTYQDNWTEGSNKELVTTGFTVSSCTGTSQLVSSRSIHTRYTGQYNDRYWDNFNLSPKRGLNVRPPSKEVSLSGFEHRAPIRRLDMVTIEPQRIGSTGIHYCYAVDQRPIGVF
jgi:hypothetical protein